MDPDLIKYLLDASWIFFALWAAALVTMSVIAFRRDLKENPQPVAAKKLPPVPSAR